MDKKVLLIEQNELLCSHLQHLLQQNGYHVHVCYKVADAVSLSPHAFDFCIGDIRLMSEFENILIESNVYFMSLPFIYLTDFLNLEHRVKTPKQKKFCFVGKPILPSEILYAANYCSNKNIIDDSLFSSINNSERHLFFTGEEKLQTAKNFLKQTASTLNKNITGFSPAASKLIVGYTWPGHILQLQTVLTRAVLLCETTELDIYSFPVEILFADKFNVTKTNYGITPDLRLDLLKTTSLPINSQNTTNLKHIAAEAELASINVVLQQVKFNKSKAAKILGVDRKTLYNKLKNVKV